MTAVFAQAPSLDALRAPLRDADARRRAGAFAIAVVMHAAALWALIVLPPAVLPQVERAVSAISVRLYTVAGGADAETDAPLFEPPLAGGQTSADPGAAGAGGAQDGAEDGSAAGRVDAAETRPDEDVAPPEPDPVVETEPETTALVEPAPDSAAETPSEILTAPGGTAEDRTQAAQSSPVRPQAAAPPPPAAALRDPGAVVATTQPPAEAPAAQVQRSGPPSFAEILARAETRLDPEDFRMLVNLEGGVQATVRENFCLSSVDANREAFDCPEGVNPDSARLAQYGLMGLGEEPPEFLEDMDRLAFQLANMGADDGAVRRILLSLQESRREVIEAGPLRRQMARDSEPENGNDIPGAP